MKDTHGTHSRGWIAVDLDGTLAVYHGWQGASHIGPPIPRMVERVREWVGQGKDVRIFTARVAPGKVDRDECFCAINRWCLDVFGCVLPVTSEKDTGMLELWDDRCVQVIPNTGYRADSLRHRIASAAMPLLLPFLSQDSQLAKDIRCQYDKHDYCDWEHGTPAHFGAEPCERCGKEFSI